MDEMQGRHEETGRLTPEQAKAMEAIQAGIDRALSEFLLGNPLNHEEAKRAIVDHTKELLERSGAPIDDIHVIPHDEAGTSFQVSFSMPRHSSEQIGLLQEDEDE